MRHGEKFQTLTHQDHDQEFPDRVLECACGETNHIEDRIGDRRDQQQGQPATLLHPRFQPQVPTAAANCALTGVTQEISSEFAQSLRGGGDEARGYGVEPGASDADQTQGRHGKDQCRAGDQGSKGDSAVPDVVEGDLVAEQVSRACHEERGHQEGYANTVVGALPIYPAELGRHMVNESYHLVG